MKRVFITGGTGYIGSRLIQVLLDLGHEVVALVRPGSEGKLPPACQAVSGNALEANSYAQHVQGCDTFVQLVGVPHPGPGKEHQFREVDRKSAMDAIRAATDARIGHFVYLSVAHPAPVMRAYIEVRSACEEAIRATGMNATILRPWYVLGPGHRWPYVLIPFYWLAERIPATRDGARRLGLVTVNQMVRALADAVDRPASGVRIVEAPEIRSARS